MKEYTFEELAELLADVSGQEVKATDVARVCADGALGPNGKVTLTEFAAYLASHVVS